MAPTLFIIGTDGPMMFVPDRMANERDKDAFANLARLVCNQPWTEFNRCEE